MKNKMQILSIVLFANLLLLAVSATGEKTQSLVLFDFEKGFDVSTVQASDAKVAVSASNTLRIETGTNKNWPGITLQAANGRWDLSEYEYVCIDVKNIGTEAVTVSCRVDNPGADGSKNCVTDNVTLSPKAAGTLTVRLYPTALRFSQPVELIGMRGVPVGSGKIDPSNVTQLIVFVPRPGVEHEFEIDNIRAGGRVRTLETRVFFPFIDEFGQYIHKDWPGKTHTIKELIAHGKAEMKDLAANPGPDDRDRYGGWSAGPKLKATGFFRTEKYRGKWWLVDPDGRLFWSHGIDCVRSQNATPITDRENYYRNLPKGDSPSAKFYGTGTWAPRGYYNEQGPYKTYDFTQANLLRKYGQNWEQPFAEVTHRRLKSWGINTIGNWSQDSIYLMCKMPYVATIHYGARRLEGSKGLWVKFPDVFDPSFRQSLRERLAKEKGASVGDPWCVGFFVDNELGWGDEVSLSLATLISGPEQPAKKVFVEDLKAKYSTIDKLNAAWATGHASWNALLASRKPPDRNKAWAELTVFYTKLAETYFRICREEVKRIAPDNLYLGCRFAWRNERAVRTAARYCDVISFNLYRGDVEDFGLPEGIDKPVVIGEFHFGALDRGMFHTGLQKTASQQERAVMYGSYVQGALRNPLIVGTHWFQYKDQPTTGRGDGENYQIGFVDICDRPYPETIQACREVGYNLYEYRLKNEGGG